MEGSGLLPTKLACKETKLIQVHHTVLLGCETFAIISFEQTCSLDGED